MRSTFIAAALAAGIVVGVVGSVVWTQGRQPLPVASVDAAKDIPNAHELPDPNMTYKVVFSVATAAKNPDEVNPTLQAIARLVNTLAKNGVPADHRRLLRLSARLHVPPLPG